MTQFSDEELMMHLKQEDIPAFEELFNRYEHRICSFLYRLGGNAQESEDGTQETFLRLWKGRVLYEPSGKFSTYVFQIAKNHFLHQQEKKQYHTQYEQAANNTSSCATKQTSSETVHDCVLDNEIQSKINKAVAMLPEKHRLVYVLSEQEHMPYKQVAEVLDCPIGTVSSRKVEAIKKLRELLSPLRNELLSDTACMVQVTTETSDDKDNEVVQ
jgi:RNA polymerase sigma-70 factor, ECF subfamily